MTGCASSPPSSAHGQSFGVFGDIPYTDDEVQRVERLIDEMNAQQLAFVVHVGDIGASAQACSDAWLLQRKQQFSRIRHPFVLLPGDNEWTDCKNPLERLRAWRKVFCFHETLEVKRQDGEFCEHLRWEARGWVFVALNVPGSNNNVRHAEHAPRMAAVLAWLDEAAQVALKREGLVVLIQANPFVTAPRDGFAAFRERLSLLGTSLRRRLLLIHGDTHLYRFDEPIPGMRRLEVWGSPFVGWTRVDLGAEGFSVP